MTNDTRHAPLVTQGERYLSVARVCDKFSRKKSWLYATLATDKNFPRPLRVNNWMVFPESQLDAWIIASTKGATPQKPTVEFWKGKRAAKRSPEQAAA